jgi:hypothetical protein
MYERKYQLTLIALTLLVLVADPPSALAQNCALCYTQAASAGARMIQALKSGILILVAPPTLMSVVMIFVVYQKRNQVRRTEHSGESSQDW